MCTQKLNSSLTPLYAHEMFMFLGYEWTNIESES